MTPAAIAVAIAVPLAGWRLYMRMRRLRTRQRLGARRPWVNVVLAAVLVMVLGLIASSSPPAMAGLGVGVVAGGGLGLHALRRTVFEATPAGLFYTPGSRAGVLLGLLSARASPGVPRNWPAWTRPCSSPVSRASWLRHRRWPCWVRWPATREPMPPGSSTGVVHREWRY